MLAGQPMRGRRTDTAGRGGGEAERYVLESATGARIKVPGNFDMGEVRRLWEMINERGGNQG